jgi:DNA polymerase-3 subunit gamma/tau
MARITAAVIDGDRPEIIRTIAELTDSGTDLKVFARELLQFVRNLMVMKITGGAEDIIDVSEVERSSLAALMQKTSEEHSTLLLSELIRAEPGIRSAFHPRVALEMILIKLSLLSRFTSVNEALKTLHGAGPAVSRQREAVAVPAQAKSPAREQEKIKTPPVVEEAVPDYDIKETSPEEQPGIPEEPRRVPLQVSADAPIGEIWNAAVESIDETNHPLASRLRQATLSGSGDDITLVFTGGASVHMEPVKESLPLVHAALQAVTGGRTLRVRTEKAKSEAISRKELKEKALKDPVVNEALELFEGRIVDVIPVKKGGEHV